MDNGTVTLTGNITWPQITPYPTTGSIYTSPMRTRHEVMLDYAGLALQALIARELSQINTDAELVERAWKLAAAMLIEGQKHGVCVY